MSSSDKLERAIKASAEDTSGFEPRVTATRLKSGSDWEYYRAQIENTTAVPSGWVACIVVNYLGFDPMWDHNLVNYYFNHEEDPTTTIFSFRAYKDGRVESTDVGKRPMDTDVVALLQGD